MIIENQAFRELPRYKSHKEVWALKIAHIKPVEHILIPAEPGYGDILVTEEYMRKHNPQVGGYWVRYKDGYESFSPAPQFEEGNTRVN